MTSKEIDTNHSNQTTTDTQSETPLKDVLSRPVRHDSVVSGSQGITIGELVGIEDTEDAEMFYVDHSANPNDDPLPAVSTVPLQSSAIGQQVALVFEQGDPAKPIILGVIQHPMASEIEVDTKGVSKEIGAEVDGERVTLTADKEIVLQCGKASITLTRAGKILIKGEYVLSRSRGVHKIKGGSVQIN